MARKVRKVIKGLEKASKTHVLKKHMASIKKAKPKSRRK